MQTEPLTPEQQNWLRVNAYFPVVMIFIMLVVLVGIFTCLLVGLPDSFFVRMLALTSGVIVLLVLSAAALHIYNNYMDLHDGVTQIRIGKLTVKRETGRSPKTFHAEFEHAGSVIVTGEIYEALEIGQTYNVKFSPRTRRGWEVEAQR